MGEKNSNSFCIRCGNRFKPSNIKDVLCDKCKKETKTKEKDISPINTIPQKDIEMKTLLLKYIEAVTIPHIEDKKILKAAEDAVPLKWNEGDIILDLYEVKGSLGEGGMGEVHKVYHKGWNINLAVKRPKDMLLVANTLQDIYQNEIKTSYHRECPKELKLLSDSINNKALSLMDLGNHEEAIKVFNQTLETEPSHPNATYNLGLLL